MDLKSCVYTYWHSNVYHLSHLKVCSSVTLVHLPSPHPVARTFSSSQTLLNPDCTLSSPPGPWEQLFYFYLYEFDEF